MRETKVPPEFEWIKPGVKVVDIAEDCPICADVYEVATAPKWNQIYGAWLVKIVDEGGYHDCSTIKQADQTITLTLTREQAEALLKGIEEIRWCCQNKPVTELGKQIEDKLK